MIQVTPQMRILVAVDPQDFRKGIDGLAQVCRAILSEDPFQGTLFLFINRRRTAIKSLCYDSQGFWLMQKRLSKGKFSWWPDGDGNAAAQLAAHELQVLLWNGNPSRTEVSEAWRQIPAGRFQENLPGFR
jgi:transposase